MSTLHMSTLTALCKIPPVIASEWTPPQNHELHPLFMSRLQKTDEDASHLGSNSSNSFDRHFSYERCSVVNAASIFCLRGHPHILGSGSDTVTLF